jgi:hypothetical protein
MKKMEKKDFKKELKYLYQPPTKTISTVEVPKMDFLMIDGTGDPNTSKSYQEAIEILFSVSYTLKFMIKKSEKAIDYGVMPLEGLWWMDDMEEFSIDNKDSWKWTAMIMQPEYVNNDLYEEAKIQVKKKKDLPALSLLRFESYTEGNAAQIMHIGPFSEEGPTIEKIHNFIRDNGFKLRGKHHEIYLSDFRRTAPEKLRTVIRQGYE